MYLGPDGYAFLFLALAVAAIAASIYPGITAGSKRVTTSVGVGLAFISALLTLIALLD